MRKAFTLIELLVVIFIIGILMALVLPAVQYAREAAKASQCTNRQRNLATAFQTYENTRDELPGWRDYVTMTTANGNEVAAQASWVFCILPQIERGDLYEFLKTGQIQDGSGIPNIPILICPTHGGVGNATLRLTNYIVNAGTVDDFSATDPPVTTDGNVANGPFLDRCWIIADGINACPCGNSRCRHNINLEKYNNAKARLADISSLDGTAYTLLASENVQRGFWIAPQLTHFYHKPDRTPVTVADANYRQLADGRWTPSLTGQEDTIEGSVGFCWPRFHRNPAQQNLICQIAYPNNGPNAPYRGFNYGTAAMNESLTGPFVSALTDGDRVPCFVKQYQDKDFSSWYQSARPSSYHVAVFTVSFCDGNVRRLNENISETVFVQLMTVSDIQSDAGWRFPPGGDTNFLEGKLLNTGVFQ